MALTIWLTDRSRYEEGTDHCQRGRYLRYHAGPHGYGWDKKAQSMPAVTGGLVHGPLTAILGYLKEHDQIPTDRWIYDEAISPALAQYEATVEKRGLASITDADELARRVAEQTTLLEGLIWCYVRGPLPQFHVEQRVILVEEEFVSVIGCTCGLGDLMGTAEDHDARQCDGIGWMTRGDCISQRRGAPDGTGYRYNEFKTTSGMTAGWEAQWTHRVQLVAGVLGAEHKLGAEIDEVWVPALMKGRNQREWDPYEGKASGPKFQASPLVYGGRRSANLPLYGEDWLPKWANQYYFDEVTQKRKKIPKEYARTGIWELPASYWEAGGCVSPSDYWTRWIGPEVLAEQFKLVGPIYRGEWRLPVFLRQLEGEELRHRGALAALYDVAQVEGLGWTGPKFQDALDLLYPQSRGGACESFFGDVCPNLPLCDRLPGWEHPEGMNFIPRRPHHAPELAQAIERGLLPPDSAESDEVEE
jgi:hypothetical protein